MPRLNQIIAVEKTEKNRFKLAMDTLYHGVQKPSLFTGFVKSFMKNREDEEDVPTQQERVQLRAKDVLRTLKENVRDVVNVTAQKDEANTRARANVEIDGSTILSDVPATHLLFLEKQLIDIHTVITKLPTLDPAEEWEWDAPLGEYRSKPTLTSRTKKVQEPIVLYDATDKHPAQTQLITKDVVVGQYTQTKRSGALSEGEKQVFLDRVVKLQRAVKFAREQANLVDAPKQDIGESVTDYLFG